MKRNPDALDRLAPIFEPPGRGFEDLLRRREKRERTRKVGAIALVTAVVATFVAIGLGAVDRRNSQPADPTPTPTGTALRRNGEVITDTGVDPWASGDLVAQDPNTGEVRALVTAGELGPGSQPDPSPIGGAAWSADGRWVAFEITGCDDGSTGGGLVAGLWVTNRLDGPRQLTTRPCSDDPKVFLHDEHWEWSPAGAQLVVARRSIDGDALVLIDPATGDRANLGEAAGDVTSLAWSPDGTRIAYGAVPTGTRDEYSPVPRGSVYSVGVGGGAHSLLASSVGYVSGGETGSGIRWSPDGARIAVLTEARETRLYLMNADGSDLDLLTKGVVIEHVLGSPGLVWSPDGTRMAYATFSGDRDGLQIWNASPDGSAPVLVFESPPAPEAGIWFAGGPVWSPDGTRIAFRYSPTEKEDGWLVADADGTGDAREIDELRYLSWRGGWYFCECYG